MTTTSIKTKSIAPGKLAGKRTQAPAKTRGTKKPRRSASTLPSAPATVGAPTRQATKRDQVVALLSRDEGATLDQMIAATGWLPHTTRAALTGLRKAGYAIDSDKIEGVRTYRAVAPK